MSSAATPGADLARSTDVRLRRAGIAANVIGAVIVFAFLIVLAPAATGYSYGAVVPGNGALFLVYMTVTVYLGRTRTRRRFAGHMRWLDEGRQATDDERAFVLRYPLTVAVEAARYWVGAAVVFPAFNIQGGLAIALVIAVTILLGMGTSCALLYLLVERVLRPVIARALVGGPPPDARTPGVAARLTMSWLLATAVPLVGCVALAVAALAGADLGEDTVVGAILFLALLGLGTGLLGTLVAAGSVAGPVASVARALQRVEAGELDTRVEVDDGSEVGLLEAGFNRMAAGLEERERIRDLFGRQVGHDVARAALDGDVTLGGELREVSALFVDLVGSTGLAARRPPAEVVALLNDFFAVVVRVAERHSGWVNKFEGDAALCVFGAPTELDDPAGAALAAARELRSELDASLGELDAGIGVAAGQAVAGNVGAEHRYEYTVIGDPVNEAARLCDLSKSRPGRLLASDAAVARAAPEEAERWSVGEPVVLRGRSQETRPATVRA